MAPSSFMHVSFLPAGLRYDVRYYCARVGLKHCEGIDDEPEDVQQGLRRSLGRT